VAAADENLCNSTRSTDFITPKSTASHDFRNAVLSLAGRHPFARALVNSGRLSVPAHLTQSPLNMPDTDAFEGVMQPGAPLADAPVLHQGQDSWLLAHTGGRFVLLVFVPTVVSLDAAARQAIAQLAQGPVPVHTLLVVEPVPDAEGEAPEGAHVVVDRARRAQTRLDARPGTAYLLRPDQHVAARWRALHLPGVQAALARATGHA
jgi:3-(3-hydroxy-phenyl)propionate hydroxylase